MDEQTSERISGTVLAAIVASAVVVLLVLVWITLFRLPQASEPRELAAGDTIPEDSLPAFAVGRRFEVVGGEVSGFEDDVADALDENRAPSERIMRPIRFRARSVYWEDREGRPFLRVQTVTGAVDSRQVATGRIVVQDLTLDRPRALIVQEARGEEFNYIPVLGLDETPAERAQRRAQRQRRSRGSDQGGVYVQRTIIRNGTAEFQLPGEDYTLTGMDATLPLIAMPPGDAPARVVISRMASTFEVPAQDRALPLLVQNAEVRFPGGEVPFEIASLTLGNTQLSSIDAVFDSDLPGYGIRATGRADDVRLADVQFISPKLPEEGTASFQWAVEPRAAGTFVRIEELALATGESNVTGSIAALIGDVGSGVFDLEAIDLRLDPIALALIERFSPKPLPYSGTLRGTVSGSGEAIRFDLAATLRSEAADSTFRADVSGLASFTSAGFRLRNLQGELVDVPLLALRDLVPNLPFGGRISGRFSLAGMPGEAPLEIDATFDLAGGTATARGTIDLTGAIPIYDVTGRLVGIEMQQLIEPDFPPVRLTADYALAGRGTDPATLQASARVDGTFAGWYTEPGDRLELLASADAGLLDVERFRAVMGPVAAAAEGVWALAADRAAEGLTFRLLASSIGPLGPYLPFAADSAAGGSIDLAGTVRGSLEHPAIEGTLELDEFRYGDYSVAVAEGSFAYRDLVTDSVPVIRVELGARGISTPQAGSFEAASLTVALTPPTFDVNVIVDRVAGGVLELEADGSLLEGGGREAMLRHFVIDLGQERWQLARPALITWGGVPGIRVDDLLVQDIDDPDRLSLSGTIFPLEVADFQFDAVGLPLADLFQMLGQQPRLAGDLSASGRITGGAAPVIDIDYRIDEGAVDALRFASLGGSFAYANQEATIRATGMLQPAGRIDADLTLPAVLSLVGAPDFSWAEAGQLAGRVAADSLPLAILGDLMPQIEEPTGYVAGAVDIAGTVADPRFDGSIRLASGAVTVLALQRRFTEINGTVTLRDETLQVDGLRVVSDGTANVTGTIAFEELSRPVADLRINMERFRPIAAEGGQPVAVWGNLIVTGPIPAVTLTGAITLNDGTVVLPQLGGDPFGRELEEFLETGGVAISDLPGAEGTTFNESFSINNLTLRAGNDVWFELEEILDARAQLRGELTVFKTGDDVKIFGSLEGEHGTVTLRAGLLVRRFEIRAAELRFFGSPTPNPALDITASRYVYTPEGDRVEILVNVTGTALRPRLGLATAAGVNIPEQELLSFLLFGQPTVALGGLASTEGLGQSVLGTALTSGFADILSAELEEELVEDLGLPIDFFQVRLADPTFLFGGLGQNAASFVFGWEIGGDIFVTVDAGVPLLGAGTEFSQTLGLNVEWRIDREWTLEGGIEPPIRRRIMRFFNLPVNPGLQPKRQIFVDLRRRWTY